MNLILPENVYQIAKWLCQLVFPGVGALYFGLAKIWGWPLGEEVVGTIAVVNTFLGVVLGISGANYKADQARKEADAILGGGN